MVDVIGFLSLPDDWAKIAGRKGRARRAVTRVPRPFFASPREKSASARSALNRTNGLHLAAALLCRERQRETRKPQDPFATWKGRAFMSSANGHAKRSEKGLLTQDNCVVALIDHQPQMLFGVSNFDRQSIINNTVALAKATRVFDVPVVLTTVESQSFSGNIWPQIKAVFPKQEPIERSSMNSWDDKNFVAAIERTGRKKIVLAGLWTETDVALPTVQAIHDG